MSKLFVKLGEVPANIFVDDCISIPMFLVDDADKLNSPPDSFNKVFVECRVDAGVVDPVKPEVLSSPRLFPEFEVDPDSCVIKPNGTGVLRITFRSVSMNFENRKFVLKIGMKNSAREVIGTQTQPLFVISHQLVLTEEYSDTYTWYKDEGGKDKSIEYGVHMIDRLGNRVRGKKVALKITLMYRNGQPVPQQNILTLLPDSKLVLDERSGSAVIRVRINEVSTRHQGQLFQILVSPDIAVGPSTADVCPVISVPIDVKSKRNHHKERDRDRETMANTSGKMQAPTTSPRPDENPNKRLKSNESIVQLADHQCVHEDVVIDNCFCKGADHLRYSKPGDFNAAVGNLVLWAKTVMKGMEAIQWKQVGYSVSVDGTPDLNKPLFNITNPVETITTIVQEYSDFIQPSLHYLGTVADNSNGSSGHHGHHYDDKLLGMLTTMDMWSHEHSEDISMPLLARGTSFKTSSINVDPVTLTRNHSLFLENSHQSMDPILFPGIEPFLRDELDTMDSHLENTTQYILVAPCKHKEYSVACFDIGHNLIGYYKDNSSRVCFCALNSMCDPTAHNSISTTFRAELERVYRNSLETAIREHSHCVFSKSNYADDICKMREDALIQLIMRENNSFCGKCPSCVMSKASTLSMK